MHTVQARVYAPRVNDVLSGRREANKARTRAALVAAVYHVIETEGIEALTAERVADAAGISRRTFFNYFTSVEALIAAESADILERVRRALAARPADESPVTSVIGVIEELFTLDLLVDATRAWRAVERVPAARRYALEAGSGQVAELAHEWGRRLFDPQGDDPLRAAVLTATVLTAFEEARRHWLSRHQGEIDESALAAFLDDVRRAAEIIRPAFDR
ncbi:TetR family transcriptional regulator [Mobilicoccus caccae]|uniref:TetR family transcriptional regulator n=1 Tax=Mobilicoccus caccae TaxID=1859295 RepID=A0ABQ6IW22_9MICO|nr:TetR family transcriptional regulator [Mobilicoccus caccae]